MDYADELHAVFDAYRRHGFPQQPDHALLPNRGPVLAATWYERLTPNELARMRRAVELGARGSFSWTERDNSL
jgi:hypothetical protein